VVGAFHGTGRRKGTYGALLMAAISNDGTAFKTVCKLGSGLNDNHLADLIGMVDEVKGEREIVWKNVDSKIIPDIFVEPGIVMEVLGAEITYSPVHQCNFGLLKEDAGLALRFPRFTGRFRDDKGPLDATTEDEILKMFNHQVKMISDQSS
jgi:DNA ligase-1